MTSRNPRLRLGAQLAATTVAAAVAALLLIKPVLGVLMERNSIHNGPWRTSADTGAVDANPWSRAAVAIAGLYALSRQEAIYYTAFTDSSGDALRGECVYTVSGTTPDARWWSLTVYGADHFLVPNPENRYAVNAVNLPSAATGRIDLTLSGDAAAIQHRADALPVPAQGAFSLTLRLYNPPPAMATQLASVPLPAIQRGGCA
ncbi:MAG: DUF1214 domain-containing protein [Pseudomonadota bacterium]|nr:DUF1214 domain-containing protein [Pseudomonadota bacterium]